MSALTPEAVLAMVPQQRPMRFIDEILEMDEEHIIGTYTWRKEDCAGYSSGDQSVPGFKLIEMGAQIGSVAWCIYHMTLTTSIEEIRQLVGFFTQIERGAFNEIVRPGEKVACQAAFGDEGYFRGNKIISQVEIQFDGGPKDGREVFSGLISGMWVPKDSAAFR